MNTGNPVPPMATPWEYMVHVTMLDGSQSFEILDNKELTNQFLAETIADPEVYDWVCYHVIKRSSDVR